MIIKKGYSIKHYKRIIQNRLYTCTTRQAWCRMSVQSGDKTAVKGHIMRPKRSTNIEKTTKELEHMKKHEWKGGFSKSPSLFVYCVRHQLITSTASACFHILARFSSNRLLQITHFTALTAHPAPSVPDHSICCTLLLPLKLQMTERKGQCSPAALCVELL